MRLTAGLVPNHGNDPGSTLFGDFQPVKTGGRAKQTAPAERTGKAFSNSLPRPVNPEEVGSDVLSIETASESKSDLIGASLQELPLTLDKHGALRTWADKVDQPKTLDIAAPVSPILRQDVGAFRAQATAAQTNGPSANASPWRQAAPTGNEEGQCDFDLPSRDRTVLDQADRNAKEKESSKHKQLFPPVMHAAFTNAGSSQRPQQPSADGAGVPLPPTRIMNEARALPSGSAEEGIKVVDALSPHEGLRNSQSTSETGEEAREQPTNLTLGGNNNRKIGNSHESGSQRAAFDDRDALGQPPPTEALAPTPSQSMNLIQQQVHGTADITVNPESKSNSNSYHTPGRDYPSSRNEIADSSVHTGSVHLTRLVERTAQSEMRIGLTTPAFGNIEVRTVVHANDVGVLIGSEKGDLRAMIAADLPTITNTFQQQHLRLVELNFHQSGNAPANDSSSGGNSQSRSFESKPNSTFATNREPLSPEPIHPVEPTCYLHVGLSILA